MIIAGAGLSGLIAASMLRDNLDHIFDSQSSIPNNHSALLRFRSSVVGDAVGIPFRKVKVMKCVQPWRNPVAAAISYSIKATGTATIRSSVSGNGLIEERFIAPEDFISRLEKTIQPGKFVFDKVLSLGLIEEAQGMPIISTIPMPALMDILGWDRRAEFNSVDGYTITLDIPKVFRVDVCATVYVPDPVHAPYRVSITDSRLIIEVGANKTLHPIPQTREEISRAIEFALDALGLSHQVPVLWERAEVKPMKYAKILPTDERERKEFIMWASDKYNIFSLGRFATWRPGLLLDDVVNDVRVIQKIASGDNSARYRTKNS